MPNTFDPSDVTTFWREAGPQQWFRVSAEFDRELGRRFLDAHMAAARRELDGWLESPSGALALLVLLDQLPRNVFRGTAHMFATDSLARGIADRALALGHDRATDASLRVFFYLPFEHSEALADQERAVELCEPLGGQVAEYARIHRDVIARFGRFPHRNRALGRDTTAAEQAFLDGGGFAG